MSLYDSHYESCTGCKKFIQQPHPMQNVYSVMSNEMFIDGKRYCLGCGNNLLKDRGIVEPVILKDAEKA